MQQKVTAANKVSIEKKTCEQEEKNKDGNTFLQNNAK